MDGSDKFRELALKSLVNDSQFIVEVIVSAKPGSKRVLVVLDSDSGVTIDDCAEVSRRLSKALDDAGWMEDRYMLEVASPGLDHPLKIKRQYLKNIGRELKVIRKDKHLTRGKMTEADDQKIVLQEATGKGKKLELKSVIIPYEEIEKAFVMVSFK